MRRAPAVLTTRRLLGERLSARHLTFLAGLFADPRVAAWLWPPPLGGPRSRLQTERILARRVGAWERNGFDLWVFRERGTGTPVAWGGLSRVQAGGRDEVEVGWAVAPEHWGRGMASELAGASVAVAFDRLRLPDVVSFTVPWNRASRRVMERAGLGYERAIRHAGLPHVLYRRRNAAS